VRTILGTAALVACLAAPCGAQALSAHWADLTAADFERALDLSRGTCALPFGIVEKHGPSGPLGTDLINVRHSTALAVTQEYVVVFPEYYFGQIAEARHQPGTIAYSASLQLQLLQETVAEMARNGCRKVVIVNGHGGNTALLQYFLQTQLDSTRDYVVYAVGGLGAATTAPQAQPSRPGVDGHAGEGEVSRVMAARPELGHPERAASESGADRRELAALPDGVTTGIGWYARFPNHYQGDASRASAARGEAEHRAVAERLALAFRAIKADEVSPRLQREFFEKATHPAGKKQ
jgi:creatinine amidohydrolase